MDERLKEYTHCRRCGRKLKTDEARQIGFGPICLEKMKNSKKPRPLFGGNNAEGIPSVQK